MIKWLYIIPEIITKLHVSLSSFLPCVCGKNSSSRPEVFCKKSVLKNFAKFTGKHLYQSLFLIKLQASAFSANFAKFLRTAFLTEQLRTVAASERKKDWRRKSVVLLLNFYQTDTRYDFKILCCKNLSL